MLSIKPLSVFYFNSLPQAPVGFPPGLRAGVGGSACRDGCRLAGTWQVPAPCVVPRPRLLPVRLAVCPGWAPGCWDPAQGAGMHAGCGGLQWCSVLLGPVLLGDGRRGQGVRGGDFGVPFPPSPGSQRPWVSHVTSARFIFRSCKTRTMIPFPPRRGVGRLN